MQALDSAKCPIEVSRAIRAVALGDRVSGSLLNHCHPQEEQSLFMEKPEREKAKRPWDAAHACRAILRSPREEGTSRVILSNFPSCGASYTWADVQNPKVWMEHRGCAQEREGIGFARVLQSCGSTFLTIFFAYLADLLGTCTGEPDAFLVLVLGKWAKGWEMREISPELIKAGCGPGRAVKETGTPE